MRALDTLRLPPTPAAFWSWGRFVFAAALGVALLLVLALAWMAPALLPLFPVALLGGVAAWYLFRHPLLNLCVILSGFVVISDYEEGIQFTEILYGLYYLAFLGHWFLMRWLREERLTHTREERALLLFLVLMTVTAPLTVLFGGSVGSLFSEWNAMIMLGLYFPVRDACVRYRHGPRVVLLTILGIGLAIALRNLFNYQAILLSAAHAWEVTKGRVYTNDGLLMTASVMALVFLLFAQGRRHRVVLLGCFFVFFASLILTQSRGYWVAFALGALVMFILIDRAAKGRVLVLGASSLLGLLAFAFVFLGDFLVLVIGGLFDRLLTLQSATTRDISLINRFLESAAVWDQIKVNPVLGYGMGVEYRFYDITYELSKQKSFVHNGYLSLWFRFGVWGLGLVLFVWGATAWRGVQTFRRRHADLLLRTAGLAAACCLAAFTLSANTSNPFFLNDTTFIFGLLMGLAGGVYLRALQDETHPT